jgi:hypothetical protein
MKSHVVGSSKVSSLASGYGESGHADKTIEEWTSDRRCTEGRTIRDLLTTEAKA